MIRERVPPPEVLKLKCKNGKKYKMVILILFFFALSLDFLVQIPHARRAEDA